MSPQTWNRYLYVSNNPLNLVDPLGLQESTADVAKRLREEAQNRRIDTPSTSPVTQIQTIPMQRTVEQEIAHFNRLFAPLTGNTLTNANQAIQDALQMVAAPTTSGVINPCRNGVITNFGPADPTAALQALRTTGGSVVLNADGYFPGPQNVFDGTSGAVFPDDSGQPTTVADYLAARPSVNAITERGSDYIFLDDSFNGLSRLERAQTMLHEDVVHIANDSSDTRFATAGSANPRTAGSHRINEIIRQHCNQLPQ